ncbi:MAG TPA: rhomboid family intramembrane serine protease [Gaiellaceae bacterium]
MTEPMRCYRHPDRETYVSCFECGRGICPDCMTQGPVGIRCPDHASAGGKTAAPKRAARTASRSLSAYGPYVTFTLIGINVALFVLELATGGQLNGTGSWIYEKGVLVSTAVDSSGQVVGVAEGEWWRLITAAFLHYGLIHLGMNMLVLWFIGPPLEEYFGHGRYLLVYLVSGLAGSAGALIWSPNALTVGASGAIWGIMGAALVLEARKIWVFGGQAMGLVIFNLAITFVIPGISIGGHVGGLVGGGLCALAFSSFRGSPALATLSMAAVGIASVGLAVAQVA